MLKGLHKYSSLGARHQTAVTIGVTEFLKVRGTLLQVAIVHEALAAIDPELDFQEGEQAFLTPADFSTKLISHLTNRGLRVYRKVSASLN